MPKDAPPTCFITPRRAGAAGVLGVFLFAATLGFLTIAEYKFMLSIGWEPLSDPGGAWPSGLSLGEYGWVMNAGFVVSGALLMVFAVGLRRGIRGGFGSLLLFVSGLAVAMMAFETDPILREGPRSFHGWIHDISFVVFAVSLLAGVFLLSREFGADAAWKTHAWYTLATGFVAVVCLVLPGMAYYFFVGVLLVWIGATAMKLKRSDAK
ncbi:MAG: DUF998 domain-containing protein [Rubrobacter sp.]|nr:DUF998 domain-containing protein [Rubrobacter sp.]